MPVLDSLFFFPKRNYCFFFLNNRGGKIECKFLKEEAIDRERERGRESSDGDQTQALNINAACLRELRAAVHQKLGKRAQEDASITRSQSWSFTGAPPSGLVTAHAIHSPTLQ